MKSTVDVSSSLGGLAAPAAPAPNELLPVPPRPLASPLVDQPPGGGLHEPAARLLGHAVLAASESPRRAAPPGRRPRPRRSRRTCARARRGPAAPARAAGPRHARDVQRSPAAVSRYSSISAALDGASSITCANLDRLLGRDAAGPGHGREPRRDLERPLLGLDVDDLEAGEPLLELLERPVGDHGRRAVGGHDLGEVGPGQDLGLRRARRSPPAPGQSAL